MLKALEGVQLSTIQEVNMTTNNLITTPLQFAVVAGLLPVLTGIVLAVPQTPALEPPRETTLECTIPTPGLEAPCVQTTAINPTVF